MAVLSEIELLASTAASTEEDEVETAVVHLEEDSNVDHPCQSHYHHPVPRVICTVRWHVQHHLPVEDHDRPDELDHFRPLQLVDAVVLYFIIHRRTNRCPSYGSTGLS